MAETDSIRFMVITDNHVGFSESDGVRGQDALISFEETLQLARTHKVDFILHGGDLFHDARPSRESVHGTMRLLQHYLSDTDNLSDFRVLSGPQPRPHQTPVFMIHGNHDEPTGERNLSAADLLEAAGLVHYFGKQERIDEELSVQPILMQKGMTKLALFGLGNLKDERLHRLFLNGKVTFEQPPADWFNLMTIHQNRFRGNHLGAPSKSCIHEHFLPAFLDLVVWGHEHESKPQPQEFLDPGLHVLQPGSSVAAALTAAEAQPKHIVMVEVCGNRFRTTALPLLSVRPLLIEEVPLGVDVAAAVDRLAAQGAKDARRLWHLRREWLELAGMTPLYSHTEANFINHPLLRLKVAAASLPKSTTNHKFGLQFADRVANPSSILHVAAAKKTGALSSSASNTLLGLTIENADCPTTQSVQDLVFRYMGTEDAATMLDMLPEPDLNEAVQAYVHGGDIHAIDRFVRATTDAVKAACISFPGEFDKNIVTAHVRNFVTSRADTLRRSRLPSAAPITADEAFQSPREEGEKRISDFRTIPSQDPPVVDLSQSTDFPSTLSTAQPKAKTTAKPKPKAKPKRLDEIFEQPPAKRRILGVHADEVMTTAALNATSTSTQAPRTARAWPVLPNSSNK